MCSRLFTFGGEEWTPQEIPVVSFTEKYATDLEGNTISIKVISDIKTFTAYKDAEEYVTSNPNYQIIGTEFAMSPVPLEKLEHYDLIYKSPTTVLKRGEDTTISQVEIFEYFP